MAVAVGAGDGVMRRPARLRRLGRAALDLLVTIAVYLRLVRPPDGV